LESIHGKSKGHWDRLPTNNLTNMVIEWWSFHGDIFDGMAWNINMGYWLIHFNIIIHGILLLANPR
jgi:hypothetical protein